MQTILNIIVFEIKLYLYIVLLSRRLNVRLVVSVLYCPWHLIQDNSGVFQNTNQKNNSHDIYCRVSIDECR